ncbi:hypothetical protein UFOVP236_21 [uncultured Caudovirales phage]|uniref:Uncharacterized protein n=1 Tax=uncultured Caudovirales phage TaxID=2100421 RepID=A0A6J7WQW0_9CAUD|nr:hypothetical protein UFOVP236_21 [uncultured Caudovirales phage]
MVSGEETRTLFAITSDAAKPCKAAVEEVFGAQNWAGYISIGNPVFNPVMNTRIVTVVCGVIPPYLYEIGARAAERKFHLDTGFMYDKMYTFAPSASELPALPTSARAIAIGFNHRLAGFGGDPTVEEVWDVYFAADPDECETFFQLPRQRGAYATFYGATYMHQTKEIVRVKTYTYETQHGHGDWDHALAVALETVK